MLRESELIIESLKWSLESIQGTQPTSRKIDWSQYDLGRVVQEAVSHRVLAHLFRYLKNSAQAFGSTIPEPIYSAILSQQKRSLKNLSTLLKISRAFDDNGIPHISLKGPTLSQELYGDPTVRISVDLDILVPREKVSDSIIALGRIGFTPLQSIGSPAELLSLMRRTSDINFVNGDGTLSVELHFQLSSSLFLEDMEWSSIWESRKYVSLPGKSINSLSNENLLFYLCSHGSKHGWERLHWLFDFAVLYSKLGSSNFHELITRAEAFGLSSELKIAVQLVADIIGTNLVKSGQGAICEDYKYKKVLSTVRLLQSQGGLERAASLKLRLTYWVRMYGSKTIRLIGHIANIRYKSWVMKDRPGRFYNLWQILDLPSYAVRLIKKVGSSS